MRETSVIRAYPIIRLLLAATMLAVLMLSGVGVQAAPTPGIIIVNTSNDDNTVNHNCTLREAIIAANTNTAVDLCPPGVTSKDSIRFTASLIHVTAPLPAIVSGNNVIVDGGSQPPNLSFSSAGDFFTLNAGGSLTFTSVNLQHTGFYGNRFCVNSAGNLAIKNSDFSTCYYGIKATAGQIQISGSVGGAVETIGTSVPLNIWDSTFSGPSYSVIYMFYLGTGAVSIDHSTFIAYSNYAILYGRGPTTINRSLFEAGPNATETTAISIANASLTLTNSIITGASAAGIDTLQNTQVVSTHNTIVGNDIGIWQSDNTTVTLRNTILQSKSRDCYSAGVGNTIIDDGNNTQFTGSCGSGIPIFDPKLDAKFVPLPGSPVIDAGRSSWCLQYDYYATLRPLDGDKNGSALCDIGAVEYKP